MKKLLVALMLVYLVVDIGYSFYQYYYLKLDGDMMAIIAPAEWYQQVLQDPFGLSALFDGERYSNPNRAFAHWSMVLYYKYVPLWLQLITNPISSVYLAVAVSQILVQVVLVWLLATYISGSGDLRKTSVLLAAAILMPLFQAPGEFDEIYIIDPSTTYTFFYALSLAGVMLFYLPFFRAYVQDKGWHYGILTHLLLLVLAIVLPLHGPLNLGVLMIVCSSALVYCWLKHFWAQPVTTNIVRRAFASLLAIPRPLLLYFSLILFTSLYSFYIGSFNSENAESVSLLKRYSLLPKGLNRLMFYGSAFPLLLGVIAINLLLIWKFSTDRRQAFTTLAWVAALSLAYTLLLPLGGYRSYRPFIVTYGPFMPVTLAIMYLFGYTTWLLLQKAQFPLKALYSVGLVIVLAVFIGAERPNSSSHDCERSAIEEIAASPEPFVRLDRWCTVMSWSKIDNAYFSQPAGQLLHHWHITKDVKTYTNENSY